MDNAGYRSHQAIVYSSHRSNRIQHKYSSYWTNMMKEVPTTSNLEHLLSRNGLSMIPLLMGILLGVATSTVLFLYPNSPVYGLIGWAKYNLQPTAIVQRELHIRPRTLGEEIRIRKQLYVGVMSAEKFLTTRATAVNKTWGKYVEKLEFFTQKGTFEQYNLRLVNLDVDDSVYPPQQKAFAMLQYMCDHYVDEYDWFIRSDDDVYMKVGKLRELLNTMDRDKQIVLGQPGYGTPEEKPTLGLDGTNFCMGGPGVIFSRPALLNLCPHIDQCKREVYSNQEDVEIGRCVTKHLGLQCTRAWDTLKMFYHAYTEDYGSSTPFTSDLENDVHFQSAITLHHAKEPNIMYNIHFHHLQDQYRTLQQEINQYTEKVQQIELKLNKTSSQAQDPASQSEKRASLWERMKQDVEVPWNYFTKDAVYGDVKVTVHLKGQLQEVVQEALQYLKSAKDDNIKIEQFDGGYWRHVPSAGIQYMLDFSVTTGNPAGTNHLQELQGIRGIMRVHLLQAIEQSLIQISSENQPLSGIKILVPLNINNHKMFETFLKKLGENILLDNNLATKISLLAVVFCENLVDNEIIPKIRSLIRDYRNKYTYVNFNVVFRSTAKLYTNVEMFTVAMNEQFVLNDDLILYARPDVSFDSSFISRCKINSQSGHMIYHAYPENSPVSQPSNTLLGSGHIICGYGSDMKFNNIIQKLGQEQALNLYDLFSPNIVIFKANDFGLNIFR